MSNRAQRLGERGERAAARYLKDNGYCVIDTRWRSEYGEIDLVCESEGMLVFVEVKTRSSKRFGPPESSITARKFNRMVRCAKAFLREYKKGKVPWRIDVVSVFWGNGEVADIKHFPAVDTPYQH